MDTGRVEGAGIGRVRLLGGCDYWAGMGTGSLWRVAAVLGGQKQLFHVCWCGAF